MSSVADSRSLQRGSEETFEHVCDTCNYRGIQKETTTYCNICEETFCQTCADGHKGQKISRNHEIVSISQLPRQAVIKQRPSCRILCECSQNSEVVIYCQTVICLACSVMKHRLCQTVSVAEKGDSYPKANFAVVAQRAKKLNNETHQLLNERKSDLRSYTTLKEKAKREIQNFRKKINRQIDLMEQTTLKELENRESKTQQDVDRHASSCKTTEQLLRTDLKLLSDIKNNPVKANMFAADVKISKRLTEYEYLLRDIRREAKSPSLTFKRDEKLHSILTKF